jgi:hypothetical protein
VTNDCCLQGGFVAAIQAQLMGFLISPDETLISNRVVNVFCYGGLILDVTAAMLAFLTGRWLDRLTESEKSLLEQKVSHNPSNSDVDSLSFSPFQHSWSDTILCTWLSISLFIPLPLLVLGFMFMLAGVYANVWAHHSTVVASLVTLFGAATLPFVAGDFFIGRNRKERRMKVITRLSKMQGDW